MTSIEAIEKKLLEGGLSDSDASSLRGSDLSSHSDEEEEEAEDSAGHKSSLSSSPNAQHSSISAHHSGPKTGVKGVRNDAKHQAKADRQSGTDQIRARNTWMQSKALGRNRTWEEDEAERRREAEHGLKPGQMQQGDSDDDGQEDVAATAAAVADNEKNDDDDELRLIRQRRLAVMKSQAASNEARRLKMEGSQVQNGIDKKNGSANFGHLREVGADQLANAIDGKDKNVFIVVHIYVKHVHACSQLTSALSSLARLMPSVRFLQIRAGSIGFGSGGKDHLDEMQGDEEAEEVVPTLLIYQAGRLLANLVRVDLEEGWQDGEERNIRKILHSNGLPISSCC